MKRKAKKIHNKKPTEILENSWITVLAGSLVEFETDAGHFTGVLKTDICVLSPDEAAIRYGRHTTRPSGHEVLK